MWTIKNGRAFNTRTGAQTMREHKRIKRQMAEARNALTPHERTSLHQKGKCSPSDPCEFGTEGIDLTEVQQAAS